MLRTFMLSVVMLSVVVLIVVVLIVMASEFSMQKMKEKFLRNSQDDRVDDHSKGSVKPNGT
jgi:hypothetical protein